MKEIITYSLLTGFIFLLFLTLTIIGLVKKNRSLIISGIISLLFSISIGIVTCIKFASKTYNKVSAIISILEPRSGDEIYTALFGDPTNDCVEILNYQDQVVPVIDYAISLHFITCPVEFNRILEQKDFALTYTYYSTLNLDSVRTTSNANWFNPALLGDTVCVYTCLDEYSNGQILYCNLDSTEVYCKDILN